MLSEGDEERDGPPELADSDDEEELASNAKQEKRDGVPEASKFPACPACPQCEKKKVRFPLESADSDSDSETSDEPLPWQVVKKSRVPLKALRGVSLQELRRAQRRAGDNDAILLRSSVSAPRGREQLARSR